MPKPADRSAKKLIGATLDPWAQWLTQRPDVVVQASLKTEFEWLGRITDVLLRAYSPDLGAFLIVNELQLRYDKRTPCRLNAYAGLAEEEYDLPVYPVVINILPPSANTVIVDRYERTFLGLPAMRHFRVINLWEVDVNIVFDQPLPALLPFVPMMRGGDNEAIIRRAVQELRSHEELRDMETVLAFFSSFVLDSRVVQQIMRWDMAVLRESPWYQEIKAEGRAEVWLEALEQGRTEGRQAGLAEGRTEGRQEERLHMLLLILEQRLGALPSDLSSKLALLSMEQIKSLVASALTVETMSAFLAGIPEVNNNGNAHGNGSTGSE